MAGCGTGNMSPLLLFESVAAVTLIATLERYLAIGLAWPCIIIPNEGSSRRGADSGADSGPGIGSRPLRMARLRFGIDDLGKEILELVPTAAGAADGNGEGQDGRRCCFEADKPYKGSNTIVMMEWEKPYMRALVDALSITEQTRVLEIGFGCGYSADRIQELRPRSHTVVEPDPVVLERLRAWAEIRPGVTIVEGFWQTALPALGRFDAIFFDDFPLPGTPDSSDLRGPASRWHAFIDLCVAHHLSLGGRITGYLARPLDLNRPDCDEATLTPFPVKVPPNCPYFPHREAYIPLVTRRANLGVSEAGFGLATAPGGGEAVGRFGFSGGATSVPPSLVMELPDAAIGGAAGSRKRQKRLALEALVKESLGLSDG